MSEIYEQLLYWINTIWRRRWSVIAVAWFVCACGWIVIASKPDTYTARTSIFVDTSNILSPLLRGLAIERDIREELRVMRQTVTSRSNLERVARMTDLDLTVASPAALQNLISNLRARIETEFVGGLLTISYTDTDPVRARDVLEALTTVFIEQNLGDKREEIENARIFLDQRILNYETQLQTAEQRLADFKRDRLSTLPDRSTSGFQLEELRAELVASETSLKRALVRRDSLRRQVAVGPTSDVALDLFEAEQELKQLLTKFKEQHPDVLVVKRRIERLRGELERAGIDPDSAQTAVASRNDRMPTVDYEELKVMLAQADAEALVAGDQTNRLRARVERLERSISQIPIVEAELAQLNRDYGVLKQKHAELVSRREQAITSQEKEVGSDRIQFQVAERPRVPAVPNGPSRPMLLTAVLVFGLGTGVAFAVFLSLINETFSNPTQLRQSFNLPVLGSVSPVHTAARQTAVLATHSTFVMLSALLILVYGVLTLNITQIRGLKLGSVPAFDEFFLRLGSLLGI